MRGGKIGDQYVQVRVVVDDSLSKKEKDLYKQLQDLQKTRDGESMWTRFKKQFE